jgi:hypothetical protein
MKSRNLVAFPIAIVLLAVVPALARAELVTPHLQAPHTVAPHVVESPPPVSTAPSEPLPATPPPAPATPPPVATPSPDAPSTTGPGAQPEGEEETSVADPSQNPTVAPTPPVSGTPNNGSPPKNCTPGDQACGCSPWYLCPVNGSLTRLEEEELISRLRDGDLVHVFGPILCPDFPGLAQWSGLVQEIQFQRRMTKFSDNEPFSPVAQAPIIGAYIEWARWQTSANLWCFTFRPR